MRFCKLSSGRETHKYLHKHLYFCSYYHCLPLLFSICCPCFYSCLSAPVRCIDESNEKQIPNISKKNILIHSLIFGRFKSQK